MNVPETKPTGHDAQPWESSPEGLEHVKHVLRRSGVPFEALIARDSHRFASVYHDENIRADSTRLLYGDNAGAGPLREVDQCISLYEEIELGNVLGVQLNLQVVVECKHRAGLQAFGFRVDPSSDPKSPLILASCLARSNVLVNLSKAPIEGLGLPLHSLALMVDPGSKGQFKPSEENLIYKGASALVDFVLSDARDDAHPEGEQVLAELGVLDAFHDFIEKKHYHRESVAREWLAGHMADFGPAYKERYFGGRTIYHMVNIYCPVVCIDAPLYDVELDHEGEVGAIDATDLFFTGVRPNGWPHQLRSVAPGIGAEAVVAVSNRVGLARLLPLLYKWFIDASATLKAMTQESAIELLIQGSFLSWVRRTSEVDRAYRSDLDYWR